MNAQVTVHAITEVDAGEVLTVQRAAFVSEALIYGSVDMPPLTQTLEELRAEIADCIGWVARSDGRLIGALRAQETNGVLLIGRIAIAPDVQGEGVGRMLLEHAEQRSAAEWAELFTGSLSAANIELYERCGYAESERIPQDDGTEQVFLRKRISTVRETSRSGQGG